MEIVEIKEFERYGYTIFHNDSDEWEIKELCLAFKTSQEAVTYLKKQCEKQRKK